MEEFTEDSEFIEDSCEITREDIREFSKPLKKSIKRSNDHNQKCNSVTRVSAFLSFTLIVMTMIIFTPEPTPELIKAKAELVKVESGKLPPRERANAKIIELQARVNLSEALLQECLWLSWNSDKSSTYIIGNYTENLLTDLKKRDGSQMMLFAVLDYGLKDPYMRRYMCPLIIKHMKHHWMGWLRGKIMVFLNEHCSY